MFLFAYCIQSIYYFFITVLGDVKLHRGSINKTVVFRQLLFIPLFFVLQKVLTRQKNLGIKPFFFAGSYKPVTIFLDFVWG